MKTVKTFFDRSAQPTNLLTVAEWRTLATNLPIVHTWKGAMRYMAALRGGAFALLANGNLVVITLQRGGGYSQRTYTPSKWGWEHDRKEVAGA